MGDFPALDYLSTGPINIAFARTQIGACKTTAASRGGLEKEQGGSEMKWQSQAAQRKCKQRSVSVNRFRVRAGATRNRADYWRTAGESLLAIAGAAFGSVEIEWIAALADCLDYIELVKAVPVIIGSLVLGIYSGWRLMAARSQTYEPKATRRSARRAGPTPLKRLLRPVWFISPVET